MFSRKFGAADGVLWRGGGDQAGTKTNLTKSSKHKGKLAKAHTEVKQANNLCVGIVKSEMKSTQVSQVHVVQGQH